MRANYLWTHKGHPRANTIVPTLLSSPLYPRGKMSNLHDILNPQTFSKEHDRNVCRPKTPSTRSTSPSPTLSLVADPPEKAPPPPQKESYYQTTYPIRPHEPHDHCPDTLDCLPDTTGRPQHTLPVILRCAILGSPKKKLTIREIYAAMEKKYPYYLTAGPAWKQSVRHHLSLNRLFERVPRPATEPGFGSYWTVNLNAPPGTKRPRKRGIRKEAPQPELYTMDRRSHMRPSPYQYVPQTPPTTLRPVDAHSFSMPAVRNGHIDDDEYTMYSGSDHEYDSDDDPPIASNFRYDPRMNLAASSSSLTLVNPPHPEPVPMHRSMEPRGTGLHGAFNPYQFQIEAQQGEIAQLKSEIDSLKRQMTEAVSVSYQMGQQLKDVRSDYAQTKQSLKTVESRLEEERRRRMDAEESLRNLRALPYSQPRSERR